MIYIQPDPMLTSKFRPNVTLQILNSNFTPIHFEEFWSISRKDHAQLPSSSYYKVHFQSLCLHFPTLHLLSNMSITERIGTWETSKQVMFLFLPVKWVVSHHSSIHFLFSLFLFLSSPTFYLIMEPETKRKIRNNWHLPLSPHSSTEFHYQMISCHCVLCNDSRLPKRHHHVNTSLLLYISRTHALQFELLCSVLLYNLNMTVVFLNTWEGLVTKMYGICNDFDTDVCALL